MSQDAEVVHPFDREDGPAVINFGGTKVAIRPSKPKRENDGINVSRETLESIKRTLYNAIDKLDRMASDKS